MANKKQSFRFQEFSSLLNSFAKIEENIFFEECVFTDEIFLHNIPDNIRMLSFKRCDFQYKFELHHTDIYFNLTIEYCKFESDLCISGNFINKENDTSFQVNTDDKLYALKIQKSEIFGQFKIDSITSDRSVLVKSIEVHQEFLILSSSLEYQSGFIGPPQFQLTKIKCQSSGTIQHVFTPSIIEIESCEFERDFSIVDLNTNGLVVQSSKFNARFNTISAAVHDHILIQNSDFVGQFDLRLVSRNSAFISKFKEFNASSLYIEFCRFKSTGEVSCNVAHPSLKFISPLVIQHFEKSEDIYSPAFVKEIYLRGNEINDTLRLSGESDAGKYESLNVLSVVFSNKFTGIVSLADLSTQNLTISGDNYSASLDCVNISIRNLRFFRLNNNRSIKFLMCRFHEDSFLEIRNSSLGTTSFFGINFRLLKSIDILNSVINEVISVNSVWFKDKSLNSGTSFSKTKDYYLDKKEIYRQLKAAMEKQQDKKMTVYFHSKELKYLNKSTSIISEFSDKVSLLGSLTNQYGRNWLLPACLAILITICFWTIIILSLIDSSISEFLILSRIEIIKTFKTNSPLLFEMLNPISKISLDLRTQKHPTTISVLLFVHRILISFLIFQTIAAFRKHLRT